MLPVVSRVGLEQWRRELCRDGLCRNRHSQGDMVSWAGLSLLWEFWNQHGSDMLQCLDDMSRSRELLMKYRRGGCTGGKNSVRCVSYVDGICKLYL
eukprot:366073-Pelagomonas_calceolata.AAC.2